MRRLPVVVLCVAGLAGTLAACSSAGGATPTTSTSTSAETTTTTPAAPTVAHPLDSSNFQSTPCSSLTTAQLQALGIPGATSSASNNAVGPACSWTADIVHSGVSNGAGISCDTSDAIGLASTYERKSAFEYWTTTTVDGYPAVIGAVADERSFGTCEIDVGVSDKMMFIAEYDGRDEPQKSQSCQLVQQVADDVIKNLGAGS